MPRQRLSLGETGEDFLDNIGSAVMAVAMIGAFALFIGGISLTRRKEDRGRGFLMMGAAAVIVANVLIWTL